MGNGSIYEAKDNDCISSIAFEHGLFWKTVWEHPRNASLKEQRKDPNILFRGDRVFVPAIRVKEESGATERVHRFRRKGVPAVTRFQLMTSEGPRSNLPWLLMIDGKLYEGRTNADGIFEVKIPPNSLRGLLTLRDGDSEESYEVTFGGMDPVTEPSGARKRLKNLGYLSTESEDESLEPTLKSYQLNRGLEVTGRLDEATRDALLQDHGC